MYRLLQVLAFVTTCGCANLSASLVFTNIDYAGAATSIAYGINNNGVIVGSEGNFSGTSAFIRSSSGVYSTFTYLGQSTTAFGINDSGQIVGTYGGYPYNAYLRSAVGTFSATDPNAAFIGINNSGTISGYLCPCVGISNLIGVPGSFVNYTYPGSSSFNFAGGINNLGVAVGIYDVGSNANAFIRDAAGGLTSFDYPGTSITSALGINDNGVIVGYYDTSSSSPTQGFIRDASGVFTTVDYPGASSTILTGINNSGEIVGTYNDSTGAAHAFLATETPEPSSTPLLIIGAGVLTATGRSKRRRRP